MTRSVFNWTFYDVEKFLRKHGFIHNHTEGSHYYYVGSHHGNARQVSVPFHGTKVFKPRTLKGIIAQSGIPKEEWLM
jgi:predicted RNA binding protein YcfA (HicA-like mRNA interferase family)